VSPWVRFGLPLLFAVAIIPCLMTTTGGPFGGGLYHTGMFLLSLPALYGVGFLRDQGILPTPAHEAVVVLGLQYLFYFAAVSGVGAAVAAIRHRRRLAGPPSANEH
jgi:hypothetical protein